MDWFDSLLDKATGVYKSVLDYDLRALELDFIRQARASEIASVAARAPVIPGTSNNALLWLGALAVGGVVVWQLARR
jgi:hypothetical protein